MEYRQVETGEKESNFQTESERCKIYEENNQDDFDNTHVT